MKCLKCGREMEKGFSRWLCCGCGFEFREEFGGVWYKEDGEWWCEVPEGCLLVIERDGRKK